jgi:hypothetical protein
VDYDNDSDWIQWNKKAKMRILTTPNSPARSMAQYFIQPRPGGSSGGTTVSSLASTHKEYSARPNSNPSPPMGSTGGGTPVSYWAGTAEDYDASLPLMAGHEATQPRCLANTPVADYNASPNSMNDYSEKTLEITTQSQCDITAEDDDASSPPMAEPEDTQPRCLANTPVTDYNASPYSMTDNSEKTLEMTTQSQCDIIAVRMGKENKPVEVVDPWKDSRVEDEKVKINNEEKMGQFTFQLKLCFLITCNRGKPCGTRRKWQRGRSFFSREGQMK